MASFFVWNRTANPGANLQWDYHIGVVAKRVENLSLSRTLVLVAFLGLPIGLIATVASGVWRERKSRLRSAAPPPFGEGEETF